jgi:hypothetical protein
MAVKVFVFDRHQRIPEDRRKVIVASHHSALQRKRSDHAIMIVIQLRNRTGPVRF